MQPRADPLVARCTSAARARGWRARRWLVVALARAAPRSPRWVAWRGTTPASVAAQPRVARRRARRVRARVHARAVPPLLARRRGAARAAPDRGRPAVRCRARALRARGAPRPRSRSRSARCRSRAVVDASCALRHARDRRRARRSPPRCSCPPVAMLGGVARRDRPAPSASRRCASPRGIDGAPRRVAASAPRRPRRRPPSLGALPGFASTVVIVLVLLASPWLIGARRRASRPRSCSRRSPARASLAIVATRARRAARDGHDPARRLGARSPAPRDARDPAADRDRARDRDAARRRRAALPQGRAADAPPLSDGVRARRARVPRARDRRPRAPDDPTPWLVATLVGAAVVRRSRSPAGCTAHRSSCRGCRATLPITAAARARAKLAWLVGWWTIFVAIPALFASLRQADPPPGLALLGGGTVVRDRRLGDVTAP